VILQTGVGIAVACWAFARTFTNMRGGEVTYLVDLVVCAALLWAILKGVFA
jgi:hypothetical protein